MTTGWYEWMFLIPVLRNGDRKPHDAGIWAAFMKELTSRFPGFTGPEDEIPGQWEGVSDLNHRFTIAMPDSRVVELKGFLAEWRVILDQESIYLAGPGAEVVFIR